MKLSRLLLAASSAIALLAQAQAFDRVLDRSRIKDNFDVELGDGTPLGRLSNGRVVIPPAGLDPQAVSSVQISPTFCPYDQLNGTAVNDACVQKAIDFACASSNSPAGKIAGELVFGRADYYLKGVAIPKSCAGLRFRGQGPATRIISDNNCTAPIINFYPDATQNYVYGGGISDMAFFNNTVFNGNFLGTTSCLKPLIQANFGRNMFFERLYTVSPFKLIKAVGGHHLIISDISGDQALPDSPGVFEFTGYGARADAAGQAMRQDVVDLNHVTIFGAPPPTGSQYAKGIWWHGFSASLRTNNVAFVNTSTILKIDCTNPGIASNLQAQEIGSCPAYGIFNDLEAEAAGSNVVDITDAQSMQFNFLYAACFSRTSTATPATSGCVHALKVKNTTFTTTGGITVNGGILNGAQASGIDYEGFQLTVTGGTKLYGNNAANVGGSDITLEAPVAGTASGSHIITGNIFCMGPSMNSINENALNSIAGNDYVVFMSNSLKGCAAGIIGSVGSHGVNSPNAGP